MTEKLAKIKPYFKYEIAKLYRISRKKFMSWIKHFETFKNKLEDAGYIDAQHIFTQKQVEIIFNHLGHPEALNDSGVMKNTEKVLIIPYTKFEIARMYEISPKTLVYQLKNIPDKRIYARIMKNNENKYIVEIRKDKKLFTANETKLIFQELGHPYKLNELK